MNNTYISEIMSREKLPVLKDSETLNAFFNMGTRSRSNCYIVNRDNILQGMIDDRAVLEYTAPLMAIVDRKNSRNLMERIRNIPLSDIAVKPGRTLNLESTLHEVLQHLHVESRSALPVLDDRGTLLGEITITSVFQKLDSDEESCCEDGDVALKAV